MERRSIFRPKAEQLESRRPLATLVVTTAEDSVADDGQLSLREAVLAANTNAAVDGVSGDFGLDVIRFDPSLNGSPIAITQGQLLVTDSLTIEGNGPRSTRIAGDNNSRIFRIEDFGGQGFYRFVGLSVTGGEIGRATENDPAERGGALFLNSVSDSRVLIRDVSFVGNSADVGGAVTITNAVTHIDRSQFSENQAEFGGAVALHNSTAVITNTTISGNTASLVGGGIEHFQFDLPDHGAGSLTLINNTIIENDAPFGRNIRNGSDQPDSVIEIGNSIIFGGEGSTDVIDDVFNDAVEGAAVTRSLGHNILDHTVQMESVAEDLRFIRPSGFVLPLADNGGSIDSRAVVPLFGGVDFGSNALAIDPGPDLIIGTVDDLRLENDQRGEGFDRIVNGGSGFAVVDAGAFERQQTIVAPSDLVVSNTDDVFFESREPDLEDLTLREAVELANLRHGPNTISFAPELGEVITLADRALFIRDDLELNGPGADQLTIDANHGNRHIVVQTNEFLGTKLLIRGLTLINGSAPSWGGAIFALRTELEVRDMVIRDNETPGRGGAIFANQTETHVIDSVLADNRANGKGGAISYFNASGSLRNVDVTGNHATNGGTGFHAIVNSEEAVSEIEIADSRFSANTGAGPDDLLLDSTVTNNRVRLTITDSVFASAGTPWTNPIDPTDVDASGQIEPGDALVVINELARRRFVLPETDDLVDALQLQTLPGLFYDVTADGKLSPLDALRVINALSRSANAIPLPQSMLLTDQLHAQSSTWLEEEPSVDAKLF